MSGRRLVAAAGAAVFGLLLVATPASAAEKPKVEWTRPTADDPVLESPGPITATISTREEDKQGIKSVTFELVQPIDDPEHRCFVKLPDEQRFQEFADKPTSKKVELDLRFPCNGAYELKAFVKYEESLLGVPITEKDVEARLSFDVAIPPAQVSGLKATYDESSKQVRLTWTPNNPDTEADLLGYRVQRNPPGPSGFEPVGDRVTEPAFTDTDIDAEHRYRVIAVRAGPRDIPIDGAPSAVVTVGPDTPEPTVSKVTPTTRGTTATTRSRSGGNRPSVRRRTATTVDTGFSRDLPFDPNQTTTSQLPATTEPDGQAAVLAEFDDDDEGDDDRRATLVPIAGGLALLMSAVHMRLLSNRVGEDDIPILPGG